jgi:2-haloacid dehalogenase
MSAVTTMVWDLGGVLIRWDPRALYRRLLPPERVDAFLTEIGFAEWNHRADAGRPMALAVAELAEEFPHHRALIEAYPRRFVETLLGPVPGSVELLERLHRDGRVRLLALTNWSADTFGHARRAYAFLDRFEAIMVSGHEGLAKPDPEIFTRMIARFGLDPGATLFVDDVAANVEAARSVGIRALPFIDAGGLARDLTDAGVLTG